MSAREDAFVVWTEEGPPSFPRHFVDATKRREHTPVARTVVYCSPLRESQASARPFEGGMSDGRTGSS